MGNKRISELNELRATEIATNDLFLVTDVSVKESKRVQAESIMNFVITQSGVLSSIVSSDTASYLLYHGYDNGTSSFSISSSNAFTSSYSLTGYSSVLSNTTSYINPAIVGKITSSISSDTASYLLYSYQNGTIENAKTASIVTQANSASYLIYNAGVFNGTASYALSCSNAQNTYFNGTASFLSYNGYNNGTASYAMKLDDINITASFLRYTAGINNGTASYAINSYYSVEALSSGTSSFLYYNPLGTVPNGTCSYSIRGIYADSSGYTVTSTYSTSASYASSSISSSVSLTSSLCLGTSSFAITSSRCIGTSSFATIAGQIIDQNIYRMYGPYMSNGTGGVNTTSVQSSQTFAIAGPNGTSTTVIIMAISEFKNVLTNSETATEVTLYLNDDVSFPTVSYTVDTMDLINYINYTSGAMSGYAKTTITLAKNVTAASSSTYIVKLVKSGGSGEFDTTRATRFFIFTKPDANLIWY